MKNNKKHKKGKLISKTIISLILLLIIFLLLENVVEKLNISTQSYAEKMEEKQTEVEETLPNGDSDSNPKNDELNDNSENDESECMYKYLSDIEYIKDQSSVQWGSITLDGNLETQYNGGLITLLVNGKKTPFLKGVSAHANSVLVYDISKYNFDVFTTYIGVDQSRGSNGNGVKFSIYTSQDGTHWDLKTETIPPVLKGDNDALFKTIDIKGAKYLKLCCNNNGNNASDHSVYANAKLFKEGYVEPKPEDVDFIKTVEQYDEILKNQYNEALVTQYDENTQNKVLQQKIEATELTLLQREFVDNVGYDMLLAIVNQNEENMETVRWLMTDINNLRLYVLGGAPDGGSYYHSITQLSRLYTKYKDDFTNTELTHNKWYPNLTKGEVYKKMAISLSLTHATKVGYWAQIDHPSNRSDALERYRIYKKLYDEGKFKVSDRQDQTPWYEALTVEEMRYVMNNITDDEELIWFNEYTQKRIDEHPNEEEKYLQPHTYIAYVYPNFEDPRFHDPNMKEYWDEKFEKIFSEYGVTYSTENDHVYKAWMSMRNEFGTGAVCGGISKLGCHIRAAHGTPASVIGQPGHAAIIYYRKTEDGKGYWTIDNDVSGWAQSGKSEKLGTRMPLGWGNDSYVSGYAATYIVLAQEAMNDNQNYEESEKIIMTARLYDGDLAKQEEIYREALKVQKINIDAWWGLINTYKADSTKTDEDYYKLAEELGEALMPFPLPMKNLLDQISEKITTVEYSFKYVLLETKLLNDAKTYEATDRVLQPSITRTVANYLLGQTDTALATFSFDGIDEGKIVLASRFDNTGVRWDYSLDGKNTWTEVYFGADQQHKLQLTKKELAKITAQNDIYVHIVGTDYTDNNIYKIDIEEQKLLDNYYVNDLENRIVGVNLETQWRYNESDEWTSYSVAQPDLTGNKTIQIRQGPTGTKLATPASEMYEFTEDNQPDTRKYIKVAELSVEEYSTQSVDGNRPFYAPNAIDANLNTMWHTDFRYSVLEQEIKPFLIIKLDQPKYVSAVEFIQTKYIVNGQKKLNDPDDIKNVIVYVSEDGENWTEAGRIENCTNYGELKDITFNESVYAQYVKLEIETYDIFASLAMVNLYEDVTKIDTTTPTAGIYYSTKERTNGYVIAKLVNPSTEIEITNNNGNDTYVFNENGSFTFEFQDKNGNKGTATANVTWIDKEGPTADVEYELDQNKKLFILLDSISEDVYLLDEDNNKINYIEVEDGKIISITYLHPSGEEYKTIKLDGEGNTTQIIYKNTTGKVSSVDTYVTTLENGKITTEEFFDEKGDSVTIKEEEKETLRKLQQVKANPLEYTFEESGDYEFKLLDKASNIAYKSIKVDYLENSNIMASDMTYSITQKTNKDVVATINPYIINSNDGTKLNVKIMNKDSNTHTFTDNGEFTFKYKDALDIENFEVKEHKAEVNWIDKDAPTAKIEYSTQGTTDGPVVATLTGENEAIVITNNNTNREYTFTKNGEFTFEFTDEAGNTGKAIANVNWIKEESDEPTLGDVNSDDQITATDLLLLKRHLIAGEKQEWILSGDELKAIDINQDNQITATDLLLMKRLVLKQIQ